MFKISSITPEAVLTFFGVIGASMLGFLGVLFTQRAPQEKMKGDAWAQFLAEVQKDRATQIARVSELEEKQEQVEGDLRQARQRNESLQRLLLKHGVEFFPDDSKAKELNDDPSRG